MKKSKAKCYKCSSIFDISPATKSRHIAKYGHTLCKKCTTDIIKQSSKTLWQNQEYRDSHLEKLHSRSANDISAANKKAWITHREVFMQSHHSRSQKMAEKWQECDFRNRYTLTTEEFITKANQVHNFKYNYCDTHYIAADKKVCIICPEHGEFWQEPRDHTSHAHGCPRCPSVVSSGHKEIIKYLETKNINFIINDREALKPLELDIWIPDKKLAIEYHGVYWHSYNRPETKQEIQKHSDKAKLASQNNIKLLQFFETEWLYKKEIVCSIINHNIHKSIRIHGRECSVVQIPNQIAIEFLNKNHLQGGRNASYHGALYYDGEIVSIMSISRHTKYQYELIRYATKINHVVNGGFTKLLKYASIILNIKSMLTYADMRYSIANVYKSHNFKLISTTKPNYYYIKNGIIYNRQLFQKHKLRSKLDIYDPQLSEPMNMFNNGYRRLWDAGNYKLLITS